MKTTLKLTRIGNSRGIRLPKRLIDQYGIEDEILVEERDDNLVLTPVKKQPKLDWEATYKQMAASDENWDDWDTTMDANDSEHLKSW
jgi:antitoxin MazE